jgi:polyhydroxybutyrate depolymerase
VEVLPGFTRDVGLDVRAVGLRRSYRLHAPPREPGRALALVVAVHGAFSGPERMARRSGFSELADQEGFAIAYARGHGLLGRLRHWNSGHCCGFARKVGIDDVGYLKAVIEDARRQLPIDASRIYMVGHSNGGMLTYRFAAEHTGLLAAVAVSSGTVGGRPDEDEGEWLPPEPSHAIPILHVHGRADPIVQYEGGEDPRSSGRTWISAPDSARFWAEHNGCEADATESREGILTLAEWSGCRDGAGVRLYSVDSWGHHWAGPRLTRRMGAAAQGFDAASVMWRFFSQHRREALSAHAGTP